MFKYIAKKSLNFSNIRNLKTENFNNILNNFKGSNLNKKFFFTTFKFNLGNFKSNNSLTPYTTKNENSNVLIKYQKCGMRSMKSKRKLRAPDTKFRIRNHSGLMKRIRIVGPVWNRGFKYYPSGNVHKMTNKSSGNLKRKRQARYIHKSDLRRVKRLIPYFMRQKFKH